MIMRENHDDADDRHVDNPNPEQFEDICHHDGDTTEGCTNDPGHWLGKGHQDVSGLNRQKYNNFPKLNCFVTFLHIIVLKQITPV